ncbi:DUF4738 domain-containing protein [Sporocytophaga myxococcoides]|uniref:DUF4738 domain-containing protein n=1 Tax=Sporocytophaga myxococcoides TaxID=153721 RepID=UPI00048FD485|nr:DUF4738 domain-containing protein [Sporocytophaga myxococcoides]
MNIRLRDLLLYVFGVVFILSCESKKSGQQSENKKSLIKRDTITSYFPERREVHITDTILDPENGFKVLIKKTSLKNKFVVQSFEADNNEVQKHIYYDNSILVKVFSDNKVLLDTLLTKDKLEQIGDRDFLKQAILYNAWIDSFDKDKQEVVVLFSVNVPDTDWAYDFSIIVSKDGRKEILLDRIE